MEAAMKYKYLFIKELYYFLAAGTLLLPALALAQSTQSLSNYPVKPIRLIVPFVPGGSTTIVARLIGQKLTSAWGQQVVVDNRGGGNTIIGSEAMVKAAPDGYTILHVTSTHVINPSLLKTPYDAVKDFAPVATMVATETLLVVTPSLPANTLQELIALARAKPGQLNFASSGSGTTNHLAIELFSILAGIKMQHIPHKGAGPAVTDLIAGQVQVFTNNALPLTPFVKSGRIRALAVSGETRLLSLPDVPTFTQAGLPGYDVKSWQGILAPANTPATIIDKLSNEIGRILRTPDVRDTLLTMGADPFPGTPRQLSELIKADLVKYAKLIRDAKIRLE
jgi:tripartite-type tricarboxylate transporter receptor subunit TctC